MNERLLKLCLTGLHSKNLRDDAHKSRLKYELKQISIKEDDEYFLDLHDKKLKYPLNQYNLLVVYLLGLADDFDIDARAAYEQGEMPDIDIDYIPQVQDYIRSVWAPKQFGERNVCSIGTVGSLGIKSAILDMTKLHDLDKTQIQMTTVSMDDKDDEGKPLEWDKAIELYPDFASFCAENPVVAEDAQAMLDRNKSAGVHAGGLIISSVPIDNFVPLEVRKVDPKTGEGVVVSAWSEGLKSQDLQAVGLVKFDVLAIISLLQIAYIIKLIKERHPEVETICALPDDYNWSDTAYLNDPVAIEMANKADLRGVFQFDSEGIRKLVQRGGVTSFDDLVAYNSLFRPSCLTLGMDARYYKRKRGEEEYFLHPLIEPILGRTYGVMVYQEQILRILHVVGDIPLIHCEKVRKAISKKKVEAFQKYKEMFLINGQKNLNANLDFVEKLWDQVVAFSGYGFNKSHATAYSMLSARLLWLKAYYPIEFYTAILMCEKDTEKYKDFCVDAEMHGVEVRPVDINKSKDNFSIVNNKIYFGFSNIKNIGAEVGTEIIAQQPYSSFKDFLMRFGTSASVLKGLISIGVFDELEPKYDHLTLYKFSLYYAKLIQSKKASHKRYLESLQRQQEDLRELLKTEVSEDDPNFELYCSFSDESVQAWEKFKEVYREEAFNYRGEQRVRATNLYNLLIKVLKGNQSTIRNKQSKEEEAELETVQLSNFNSSKIKVDEDFAKILENHATHKGKRYYPLAESFYYGFQWSSNIERSPLYKGYTIDDYLDKLQKEKFVEAYIEVEIMKVEKRKSKSGTEFYSVTVEDANGKSVVVNVWLDDYLRFAEELKKGNLARMMVRPPSGGYRTFSFSAPPKRFRDRSIPKNKEDDLRLIILPESNEDPRVNLEDLVMKD